MIGCVCVCVCANGSVEFLVLGDVKVLLPDLLRTGFDQFG